MGAGWLLGGVVGLGTLAYALAIGPLAQLFLPMFTIRPHRMVAAEPKREPQAAPLPASCGS